MADSSVSEPASGSRRFLPAIVGSSALVVLVIAAVAWLVLRPADHLSVGSATSSFDVECDFDRFRQIMVRKNATAAIVAHGGMTLLADQTRSLQVDTSVDDRPILNAIRGKSKANVSAEKQITVELIDPYVNADKLVLNQDVQINETGLMVNTTSREAAGNLQTYSTTLNAAPSGSSTNVELTIDMKVIVQVSPLFTSVADRRVQEATDRAIAEQRQALETFIGNFANEILILPDLNR